MKVIGRQLSLNTQQPVKLPEGSLFCTRKFRMIDIHWPTFEFIGQIVRNRRRSDKIAVDTGLEQRVRSEPVCAVVREISFAHGVQARNGRHELIVHPQPAHGEMGSR